MVALFFCKETEGFDSHVLHVTEYRTKEVEMAGSGLIWTIVGILLIIALLIWIL